MTDTKSLDIDGILARLPHRFPFLMVDRVLDVVPGKSIVAVKNVSANEAYFQGHFPGHPVMPGVLIIEALAQAGGVLAYETAAAEERIWILYLVGIDKTRFKQTVRPGDQLMLTRRARASGAATFGASRPSPRSTARSSPRRRFSWRTDPSLDRPARRRRSLGEDRRRRPHRRLTPSSARTSRSDAARASSRTSSSRGRRSSAPTITSSSSPRSATIRRTRSTPASGRGSSSAIATRSASTARSIAARLRTKASRRSATTTGSWPTATSRTTASSATTRSSRTTRRSPATCTSATTRSSAASRLCTSSAASARTRCRACSAT